MHVLQQPSHQVTLEPGYSQPAKSFGFLKKPTDVNLYHQPGTSNLIGLKLEGDVASKFIQHGKVIEKYFRDIVINFSRVAYK